MMKSPYICTYHAERMKACETEAFRYWLEMMRRGMQAYAECRMDAANIYLGSALEIGVIRNKCKENGIFSIVHVIKPTEFLIQLMLLENRFHDATLTLSNISSLADEHIIKSKAVIEFLSVYYEKIEKSEKEYFSGIQKEKASWVFETPKQEAHH